MATTLLKLPASGRGIDKYALGDAIFVRLLADILSLRYQPGERLNVDLVAEEFGVSRTPVREALLRLANTGFIDVVRNSRTLVSGWEVRDIRDRLEIMGRLVGLILRDPRLDLSKLAIDEPVASIEVEAYEDIQRFLNLASTIVSSGVNHVAGYMILELLEPLRLFFQDDILRVHGLDLSSSEGLRSVLMGSVFDAALSGDAAHAGRLLEDYVAELAGATSPRAGHPDSSPQKPGDSFAGNPGVPTAR